MGAHVRVDKYATLLLFRINFNVSGNIVASVICTDECGNQSEKSFDSKVSSAESIEIGLNIPATLGSRLYGWKIGAILNAIILDLKLNEGLQGLGKNLEVKAAIINAYGPDLICNNGWPSI